MLGINKLAMVSTTLNPSAGCWIMTASRIRWLIIFLIYGAFHLWYGGNGEPMTEKEVAYYVDLASKVSPDAVERVRQLASTHDGKEFVMVNLNKYRPEPKYSDGRAVTETSKEVEQRYLSMVVPMLFARACHPIVVTDPAVTMVGDLEQPRWERIALARYRSRQDFLEIMLNPEFNSGVEHKWAALETSHTMLTVPQIWGFSIRLAPLLFLLVVGLTLDRYLAK